jgi:hypothetical protein
MGFPYILFTQPLFSLHIFLFILDIYLDALVVSVDDRVLLAVPARSWPACSVSPCCAFYRHASSRSRPALIRSEFLAKSQRAVDVV